MAKYEFCPAYCLRDPEKDPLGCQGCRHLEDVVIKPPRKAILRTGKKTNEVLMVGANHGEIYIEEKMSNGGTTLFTVSSERVEPKK